jgi:hypothetical protein
MATTLDAIFALLQDAQERARRDAALLKAARREGEALAARAADLAAEHAALVAAAPAQAREAGDAHRRMSDAAVELAAVEAAHRAAHAAVNGIVDAWATPPAAADAASVAAADGADVFDSRGLCAAHATALRPTEPSASSSSRLQQHQQGSAASLGPLFDESRVCGAMRALLAPPPRPPPRPALAHATDNGDAAAHPDRALSPPAVDDFDDAALGLRPCSTVHARPIGSSVWPQHAAEPTAHHRAEAPRRPTRWQPQFSVQPQPAPPMPLAVSDSAATVAASAAGPRRPLVISAVVVVPANGARPDAAAPGAPAAPPRATHGTTAAAAATTAASFSVARASVFRGAAVAERTAPATVEADAAVATIAPADVAVSRDAGATAPSCVTSARAATATAPPDAAAPASKPTKRTRGSGGAAASRGAAATDRQFALDEAAFSSWT